ncbi:MAG: histidinol-phosphatase [Hyphomicrobium sp.]
MGPEIEPSFEQLLAFANDLADAAGAAVLPYFRRELAVENKSDTSFDPVTAADRAAETVIARMIADRFPAHGLTGEEFGTSAADARYHWIVDPIDGTRAFIMGSPLWGILIALIVDGRPLIGLMDQPFTGERFYSTATTTELSVRGGPAARLATRRCTTLAHATFTTTHPQLFQAPHEQAVLTALQLRARMTRFGGDCYGYCLLASGFVDVIVEPGLKSYDIAALIPIVERAGGVVTTWDGGPAASGGDIVASGDAALHREVLALIAATTGN